MGAHLLPSLQSGEFPSGRGAAEAASGASGTSGGIDEGLVEDDDCEAPPDFDSETVYYGSAPPSPNRTWSPGLDAGLPPPSSHQMSQRPTSNAEEDIDNLFLPLHDNRWEEWDE